MTTMVSPLRRACRVAADATAVTCGDVRLSYASTWERGGRLVRALRALGVRDGERVAVSPTAILSRAVSEVPARHGDRPAETTPTTRSCLALEDSGARVCSGREPAEFSGPAST